MERLEAGWIAAVESVEPHPKHVARRRIRNRGRWYVREDRTAAKERDRDYEGAK